MNKTFKDFLKLSKGEHSLKEVIKRAGGEVLSVTYDASIDGLPKKLVEKEDWD